MMGGGKFENRGFNGKYNYQVAFNWTYDVIFWFMLSLPLSTLLEAWLREAVFETHIQNISPTIPHPRKTKLAPKTKTVSNLDIVGIIEHTRILY